MISIPTLKQGGNFFGFEDDGDGENVMVCLGPIGPEQHSNFYNSHISTVSIASITSKRNKKKEDRSPP